MTKIAVVYYSATGNIAAMANAIGEGAASVGAEVRVRRVAETAPADAIASNPKWQAHFDEMANEPLATLDDLEWADGIALGSPTRFGGPASQLKSFLDTTGGLWFKGGPGYTKFVHVDIKFFNKSIGKFGWSSILLGGAIYYFIIYISNIH